MHERMVSPPRDATLLDRGGGADLAGQFVDAGLLDEVIVWACSRHVAVRARRGSRAGLQPPPRRGCGFERRLRGTEYSVVRGAMRPRRGLPLVDRRPLSFRTGLVPDSM